MPREAERPKARALAWELRRLRNRRGLTQKELAGRCGLTPAQVSDYETGRNQPRARNLAKLAGELGVPIEALKRRLRGTAGKRRPTTAPRAPLRHPPEEHQPGRTAPGQGAPLRSRKEIDVRESNPGARPAPDQPGKEGPPWRT